MKKVITVVLVSSLIFVITGVHLCNAADSPRERLLLDFGWKFGFGNIDITKDPYTGGGFWFGKVNGFGGAIRQGYSDNLMRTVNLPHDWAVELSFDSTADGSHGFKPVGDRFPETSIGWYRRTFDISSSDLGKRFFLEFDGVFRDCRVWVNGIYLGRNENGYSSFQFDITELIDYERSNSITVRVDASASEGWFYEGAGIYRHVWLVKTSPVHIGHWGTFVTSVPKENNAEVTIRTLLQNDGTNSSEFDLVSNLVDANGKSIAEIITGSIELEPGEEKEINQKIMFKNANLWSVESPYLYKILSKLTTPKKPNEIMDTYETKFGIRTVEFDKDKGFILNGKPVILKGTCNHHDHAGVGAALPDRLQYYRIERLKEMGCNAYRTSHNPPTPELLNACDELGMLVMDETRTFGSGPESLSQLERLIKRDRNHPSVIIWSIGNEEPLQGSPIGRAIAEKMQKLAHQLDPTRLCTYAANYANLDGVNEVIDVRGWNYHLWGMDNYRKENPEQKQVGTEQGSHVTTREIYSDDNTKGYVQSYMANHKNVNWGNTSEEWWTFFVERPWLSGGFVWTGFDYRGEPTPYSWPCINSHFGIMDMCGFPKDNFYYYQAWWTQNTVLHLFPHWDWKGKEGEEIRVSCYSNCDEVELFLNGNSWGKKNMKPNSHLDWTVKYEPGTLLAKGYMKGILVAETKRETTGKPTKLFLAPDRNKINADGEDISMVTVSVLDETGRRIPTCDNEITFQVEGPGEIIGVGNGNPSSHEPDKYSFSSTVSHSLDGWRRKIVESINRRPEIAEQYDDSNWIQVDVNRNEDNMSTHTSAVYRTSIECSKEDIQKDWLLIFHSIDDIGRIYVNGKMVGTSQDWNSTYAFEIKQNLHIGKNSIAVAIQNNDGPGGLSKGVKLGYSIEGKADWKRKVFNGLAQVIIQSRRGKPGTIKLTGRSEGLEPYTLILESVSCELRDIVAVK